MKDLKQAKNLSEVLKSIEQEAKLVLLKLDFRGTPNYLFESMIERLLANGEHDVLYIALDQVISRQIQQELRLLSNPSLLLVQDGEIKSIFSGIIAGHEVRQAIAKLNTPGENRQAI